MLCVTTPVTSSASTTRGEATGRAPNRPAAYTGPKAPEISISHPLHEPASTCRICSEPRTPAGGLTIGFGAVPDGSTIRPTAKILLIQPTAGPPLARAAGAQVFQHRHPIAE